MTRVYRVRGADANSAANHAVALAQGNDVATEVIRVRALAPDAPPYPPRLAADLPHAYEETTTDPDRCFLCGQRRHRRVHD